ncbi:helix-turn-helix domain-containing protein [Streptomyces sp. NPDC055817]
MDVNASAGGNRVQAIAQPVQTDDDTVREVLHRFNEIGLSCLDLGWAEGCPCRLSPDEEDCVGTPCGPKHCTHTALVQRQRDILAAEHKERARIRREKGIRWGWTLSRKYSLSSANLRSQH